MRLIFTQTKYNETIVKATRLSDLQAGVPIYVGSLRWIQLEYIAAADVESATTNTVLTISCDVTTMNYVQLA